MSDFQYLGFHYRRVESILWLEVKTFLQKLMVSRIEQGADLVQIYLSREMWQDLDEFCVQMECAYLHPRRDSKHIDRAMLSYVGHALPASHSRQKNICLTHHVKNLKYVGKEVGL